MLDLVSIAVKCFLVKLGSQSTGKDMMLEYLIIDVHDARKVLNKYIVKVNLRKYI